MTAGPRPRARANGAAAQVDPAGDDVLSVLQSDHDRVRGLMAELHHIPDLAGSRADAQRRAAVTDRLRRELSGHEAAEKRLFWPAVVDGVPNGEALADHARGQERQGNKLLRSLSGLPPDASARQCRTDQLLQALRRHLAFEDAVFDLFRQSVGLAQRRELGRELARVRRRKHIRPHSHGPDQQVELPPGRVPAAADATPDALGSRLADHGATDGDGAVPGD